MPTINSFTDQPTSNEKKTAQSDCVKCPKCTATWFEEIWVAQYVDEHTVILGQGVPSKNGVKFSILRCIKCGDLIEPRMLRNNRDTANQLYDHFLDSMKTTLPTDKL